MARCPKCRGHVEIKPDQIEVKCPQCGAVLKRPPMKQAPVSPTHLHREEDRAASESADKPKGDEKGKRRRFIWVGVTALCIILGVALLLVARPWLGERLREAKERRVRARAVKARAATYPQYLGKAKPFYDALLRTNSDLEVGINYVAFGERLREMNFQCNKWKEGVGAEERGYPSGHAMQAALLHYVAATTHWKNSIDLSGSKVFSERVDNYERQRQRCWEVASGCIAMAKVCMEAMDVKEVLSGSPCMVCDGTGTLSCLDCKGTGVCTSCKGTRKCNPCEGTGKCDKCKGTGKCEECEGRGKCEHCKGSGKSAGLFGDLRTCTYCEGTGKCKYCEGSGNCDRCKGTGNCYLCGGTGKCKWCEGTGKCVDCEGDGRVECPLCLGTGFYPPKAASVGE